MNYYIIDDLLYFFQIEYINILRSELNDGLNNSAEYTDFARVLRGYCLNWHQKRNEGENNESSYKYLRQISKYVGYYKFMKADKIFF